MEIKGDKRGLRVLAHGFARESDLVEDLQVTLRSRVEFLGSATLLVEVDGLPLTATLFQQISDIFGQFPTLILRGIQSPDPHNGLLTLEQTRSHVLSTPMVVRHTVRSGQQITHQGDLIIVGDVNPGATLAAAGDIFVFGWLRGTVYAGQPDDRHHNIYAIRFQPSQIKIGDVLALGDGNGQQPEYAHVDKDLIVVELWTDVHLPDAVATDARYRRPDLLGHFANSSH
ncbi:MAG: septum site-determining protein MinC [Sulfobacillus sp.]